MIRLILILIASSAAFSQNATLDTNTILIGEQINFKISCKQISAEIWPAYNKNIVDGIEIIKTSKIDTNEGVISQEFVITCWDTGIYFIPPISFSSNNITDEKNITVRSIILDKSAQLKDIKIPLEEPIGWQDIWPWLLGILIIIFIIYLMKKYVFIKKEIKKNILPLKVIPAHISAMKQLNKLEKDRIWENGDTKDYYSQLSYILRSYLENRFKFIALELTTEEILNNLKSKVKNKDLNNIKTLLTRADLVKFAKSQPIKSENIESVSEAKLFVEKTKEKVTDE
jgi:hypothetical protein